MTTESMTAAQHHAEAYRLDCDAGPYLEIEHHYQEAILMDPGNVRYRADWICYLMTRGRPLATDKAWDEAAALGSREYLTLHWPVARLATECAQIDLAIRVMEAIPLDLRVQNPCWAVLWRLVRLLEQCDADELVFPESIEIEDQWKGPHLLPGKYKGKALTGWCPGRITCVEPHIVVKAAVKKADQAPQFGWLDCTHDTFQSWCSCPWGPPVQVGDFIEIGAYEDITLAARHAPVTESIFNKLPPVVPDRLRYLRRAGWVRS